MIITDVVILEWISLFASFFIGALISEEHMRFGAVATVITCLFFYGIGWIQFPYLPNVIPIVVIVAVFGLLRQQLKFKMGVFGNNGSLFWKIIAWLIILQFSVMIINSAGVPGLGTNGGAQIANFNNTETNYAITSGNTLFGMGSGNTSSGASNVITDAGALLAIGWMLVTGLISIVTAFVGTYWTLTNTFGVPVPIATVMTATLYIMLIFELIAIIWKPFKSPEI
jgi:hypothetical protein